MIAAVRPLADAYVESVCSIGLPQKHCSRFTKLPIDIGPSANAPARSQNTHYASPEMQAAAAEAIAESAQRFV